MLKWKLEREIYRERVKERGRSEGRKKHYTGIKKEIWERKVREEIRKRDNNTWK